MEIREIPDLVSGLEKNFAELTNWIENQPNEKFEVSIRPEKWSTGQHLAHLIKSTKPVNLVLRMPKFVLKWRFGINNREEKSYEALVEKYKQKLAEGGTASSPYRPTFISAAQKYTLITEFNDELKKIKTALPRWKDKDLSRYIVPHPLLGKITVRELIFFTIHHTRHHLETIQKDYS
ncbi:MAG: DinB family protein [Bacteroidia bacterium]